MKQPRIVRHEIDGTTTPMRLETEADHTDVLVLASALIRWSARATDAMSRVAPDASSFADLFDAHDEISARHGHVIRRVLAEAKTDG